MTTTAVPSDKTKLLLKAFASFSEVSVSLEKAYSELQCRVQQLSDELERTNYYLKSVLQSLPCGVMVFDRVGHVTTMNERARTLLLLPATELPSELENLLRLHPSQDTMAAIFRGEITSTELGPSREPARALSFGWSQMRNRERVLVIQDVTEVRDLEREMQEAETLAAMGKMAVEVAHEIRNPLGGLELFSSLLQEPELSREERRRYLDNVQIGIRSINTVVENMLCFSRPREPVREPARLQELLDEILTFMTPLLQQRGIGVKRDYQSCRSARVDRQMMCQVFSNLVSNSLQALPERGHLLLKTRDRQDDICVMIRDNGIGIPEQYRDKVFDPHFTTHSNGNGLGLAIVERMIQAHGGTITLESREGWGTEFTITLPAETGEP
ncbi:MAG: PAS domain-containing sensor histidine kinase [Acidobacteriota bacterium]